MNSSILIASIILVLVFLFVIICIFNFALRKGKRIIDFIILKIIVEFMVLVLMVYNGKKGMGIFRCSNINCDIF